MLSKITPSKSVPEGPGKEGQLYKQLHISGWSFPIYYGYYEEADRHGRFSDPVPIYPDFRASPVYDSAGRPFVTAMQDACEQYAGHRKHDRECGSCRHYRIGDDLIGTCTCTGNRKNE